MKNHILLLIFTLIATQTMAYKEYSSPPNDKPLIYILNEDDTLDLTAGFSGSLDFSEYNITVGHEKEVIAKPKFPLPIPTTTNVTPGTWSAIGSYSGVGQQAIAVDNNGEVYVGGSAGVSPTIIGDQYIVKWDGTNWSALGSGLNGSVTDITIDNNNVYVVGRFTTAGGATVNNIAKWDGTSWSALGSGLVYVPTHQDGDDAQVQAHGSVVRVDNNGNVYVGGKFNRAGGVTVNNIAKWNGTSWSALGSGLEKIDMSGGYPLDNGACYAIDIASNGDVYAGGTFYNAGGVTANNIAKWNGTSWSALGSGIGTGNFYIPYGIAVASNNDVYAGGPFGVEKWNGSSWSDIGGTFIGHIYTMDIAANDDLYIGGSHSTNKPAALGKWDGTSWTYLGDGVDGGVGVNTPDVKDLILDSNEDVFIAGDVYIGNASLNAMHIGKFSPVCLEASATAQNTTICHGENAVIDVTSTTASQNKAFKWVSSLSTSGTGVAFGTAAISEQLTNTTNSDITVTYTITPYEFGDNNTDDGGTGDDCVLGDETVTITVQPQNVITSAAQSSSIESGENAVIDVTNTNNDCGSQRFKWTSNGLAGSSAVGATKVAFGTGAITESLENCTLSDIDVVYTITPYSYGTNGIDDDGTGDDVLETPQTVTVTVKALSFTATPQASTICGQGTAVIDVIASDANCTNNASFKWVSNDKAGSNAAGATSLAFGNGAVTDGPLYNFGNANVTVTYTITPYTWGANGTDDGGTGDDVLGTDITVNVIVEPMVLILTAATDSRICSGESAEITITAHPVSNPSATLTHPKMAFKWEADGDAGSDDVGANGVAFGTKINDGPLFNNTDNEIIVTYTIRPYTFGNNGIDDGGTGDDCMGITSTVDVIVEPDIDNGLTATAQQATICSGNNTIIDITSTINNVNTFAAFLWEADGDAGSSTDGNKLGNNGASFGTSAITDGALSNTTNAPITVTYTITPYTFGPDGIDDMGDNDDCLGSDVTVEVVIEPSIQANTFTVSQGLLGNLIDVQNGQVQSCTPGTAPNNFVNSGETLVLDVSSTLNNSINQAFKWTSNGAAGSSNTGASNVSPGIGAITENLINTSNSDVTVTYTITPYTYGPNGQNDDAGGDDCVGSDITLNITVAPAPNATATASNDVICDNSNAVFDVTSTLTTSSKSFKWTADGAAGSSTTGATKVAFGSNAFSDGPLTNSTTNNTTVTYTITPYTWGPNGTDDGGDCDDVLGSPITKTITVEPNSDNTVTATPASSTVANNGTVSINVSSSLNTADKAYKWVADGDANSNSTGAANLSFPNTITDPVNNSGPSNVTVTYTITPYTFGPNGQNDNGGGDDCVGNDKTVNITVLGTPSTPGFPQTNHNGTPTTTTTLSETICNGTKPTITTPSLNNSNTEAYMITASGANVNGFTPSQTGVSGGTTIEPNNLTSSNTGANNVTYTIRTYNFGPNGTDDNGTGDDVVSTTTPLTATVTVEPALSVTFGQVTDICSGTAPSIPITSSTGYSNIGYTWKANGNAGSNTSVSSSSFLQSNGVSTATLSGGTLTNTGTSNVTVTYTITPYTFGPDGNDDDGDGDDCLGTPNTITVTVLPAAVTEVSANSETICSGDIPSVTTGSLTGNTGFGDGYIVAYNGNSATVGANASIESNAIANTTSSSASRTYTVTAYTYGADGQDNSGNGDDCKGTAKTVTITILPQPVTEVSATNELICHDDIPVVTVGNLTGSTGVGDKYKVTATSTNVTGFSTSAYYLNANDDLEDAKLQNTTNTMQSVTYTVMAYNFGPDGSDDNGGGDDCTASSKTVTINVLPQPDVSIQSIAVEGMAQNPPTVTTGSEDYTVCSDEEISFEIYKDYTTPTPGELYDITFTIPDSVTLTIDGTDYTLADSPLKFEEQQYSSLGGGFGFMAFSVNNIVKESKDVSVVIHPYISLSDKELPQTVVCDDASDDVTLTFTINPEPDFDNQTEHACDGTSYSFDLDDYLKNDGKDVMQVTYTWTASTDFFGQLFLTAFTTDGTTDVISESGITNYSLQPIDIVYTVTPTSVHGCVGEDFTVTVTINPNPLVDASYLGNTTLCLGESRTLNGVGMSYQSTVFTYDWSIDPSSVGSGTFDDDEAQNPVFTATQAGAVTINFIVTEVLTGCQSLVKQLTFDVSTGPQLTVASTAVTCFGGADGTATVTATGGEAPYTYLWNNGATTATITGLTAGNYSVAVTDANGCTRSQYVNVYAPSTALALMVNSVTDVSCNGGNNGTVQVTGTGGGAAPVQGFVLVDGIIGDLALVQGGNWNIYNNVGNNPVVFDKVQEEEFNPNVIPTYSYSLDGVDYSNTSGQFTGLAAGIYTVYVKDDNGCIYYTSVTIGQAAALSATIVPVQPSCTSAPDGSATVTLNGGVAPFTYSWNTTPIQTAATASNLSAGSYTVSITDANGCSTSASVTLAATDTEAPTIGGCGKPLTLKLDATGNATFDANCLIIDDNCGIQSVSIKNLNTNTSASAHSFDCNDVSPAGIPMEITVTDVNGNIEKCTMTVIIADATPPTVAECNGLVTLTLDASGNATLSTADLTISDNCGVNPSIGFINLYTGDIGATLNFDCTDIGYIVTPVLVNVSDVNGNLQQCFVYVMVQDVDAPTVAEKNQFITVQLDQAGNGTLSTSDLTITDNCAVQSVNLTNTYSFATGTTLNFTTADAAFVVVPVLVDATDVHGNMSQSFVYAFIQPFSNPAPAQQVQDGVKEAVADKEPENEKSTATLAVETTALDDLTVYPNPFDKQLTISYTLTQSTNILLTIADANGRIVELVERANKPEGEFQYQWNVPQQLAPGIYFITLRTQEGEVKTKQVIKR